jgi:hypothetical protein
MVLDSGSSGACRKRPREHVTSFPERVARSVVVAESKSLPMVRLRGDRYCDESDSVGRESRGPKDEQRATVHPERVTRPDDVATFQNLER